MGTKIGLLRRYPTVAYFVLAYAISWAFWLPLAASSHNLIPIHLPAVVFYNLAALGPVLAAVIVSGAGGGKPAICALLVLQRYFASETRFLMFRAKMGVGFKAFR